MARGSCDKGSSCGFCHLPHEARPPSMDSKQRHFIRGLTEQRFLEMLLPFVEKHVKESKLHEAQELLQLFQRELLIRSPLSPQNTLPTPVPRKIRYVLERMTLASLVGLACATMKGRIAMLASESLRRLRTEEKFLQSSGFAPL